LDASGGGVFLNFVGAAEGALNRAAASTRTLGGFALCPHERKNQIMNSILELLQDIPISAVLREKIGLIEAQLKICQAEKGNLETANRELVSQVEHLTLENQELKQREAAREKPAEQSRMRRSILGRRY